MPLSRRLKSLQAELASLESELADPSNHSLQEPTIDPGELLRGLVDVRGRLEKIKQGTEGRGKLVSVVLGQKSGNVLPSGGEALVNANEVNDKPISGDVRDLVEMDKRVAELEKLVGTSTTAVDEVCALGMFSGTILIVVLDFSASLTARNSDIKDTLPTTCLDYTSTHR